MDLATRQSILQVPYSGEACGKGHDKGLGDRDTGLDARDKGLDGCDKACDKGLDVEGWDALERGLWQWTKHMSFGDARRAYTHVLTETLGVPDGYTMGMDPSDILIGTPMEEYIRRRHEEVAQQQHRLTDAEHATAIASLKVDRRFERVCHGCGARGIDMFWAMEVQDRAADEGASQKYKCKACGKVHG